MKATPKDRPTLLLVEDDTPTRTFLADNLSADGFDMVVADSFNQARRLMALRPPDLALVDVGLPGQSGLDLLTLIRRADGLVTRIDPDIPVLILSGRAGELDRLRGFEHGADDFVPKPFSYPELRERVRAHLRRARGRQRLGRVRIGALDVDPASREVFLHGRRLHLSGKEFALLRTLAAEPTRVFTKAELLRDIWGFNDLAATRTVDSHACRLRQKLEAEGDRFIVNVWGVGYRLVDGTVPE